jgi:bla regulator protein blaR1
MTSRSLPRRSFLGAAAVAPFPIRCHQLAAAKRKRDGSSRSTSAARPAQEPSKSRMRRRVLSPKSYALLLVTTTAFAQAPTFEVASVKPQPWTGQGGVYVLVRGNTLNAEHASLDDLVSFAYNLREIQLSGGPPWADRSHAKLVEAELFQVVAKSVDPPPSVEVFRQMLQTLLAERFKLQVHHVQKNLPIYNLVVNKGGAKLKESPADSKFSSVMSSHGKFAVELVTTKMTMERLVETLGPAAGRPVFDKTGLAANYDFALEFVGENVASEPDAAVAGPSIFAALQEQLGLKLESAMAPFDTIVIDHAERPSGN